MDNKPCKRFSFHKGISFSLWLCLNLFSFSLYAQISSLREKKILINSDSILLDTLSVIPGSIIIKNPDGSILDTSQYHLQAAPALLKFNKRENIKDSITVLYRVFPIGFTKKNFHKDIRNLQAAGNSPPFYKYTIPKEGFDPFMMNGLNKSGSISRGISFGNNQDLAVNSSLNLQLSGRLNSNIDVLMAATDDNIPIQPEGNTQQLQEFDKIFIQLSNSSSKLVAGDFELKKPDSYFMNFYKKAQGISLSSRYLLNPEIKDTSRKERMNTMLSGAVSKGKYARNFIQGIENNQGPYRLRGAENELYIIVLSGSERIYLDGVLLTRGQENDYVIDYNTAEITFTPNHLITKDKRITAEFQYSDKNYARSLLFLSQDYNYRKLNLRLNAYSEQDSKNQPLQQDLSRDQKKLLSGIGDRLDQAVIPSFDSVAFSVDEVLYRKTDTLVGSVLYPDIFVYSVNPSNAFYRVRYSNVGQGNGNYNQVASSANGRVFEWIAPLGGIRQGSFEPVMQLVTPKKKQMVTGAADYLFNANSRFTMEAAASNNDLNTFSPYSSNDDAGFAIRIGLDNIRNLTGQGDTGITKAPWKLFTNTNYELVQKNFSPIERYRNVEFERDWNRLGSLIRGNQHIIMAGIGVSKNSLGSLAYHFSSFTEENEYHGIKHSVESNYKRKGLTFKAVGSLLMSTDTINKTNFFRHSAFVSQKIKWLIVGLRELQESNRFNSRLTSQLKSNSYHFLEWEGFTSNADTVARKFSLSYKQRTDYLPLSNNFVKTAFAEERGASVSLHKSIKQQFNASVKYRTLSILQTGLSSQKPDNTLIGRIEHNLRLFNGALLSSTFYEIGSGLEAKKEFAYLKVAAGQGVYSWIDYNSDNIPQLTEFEVAAFPSEADYVRVLLPTSNYIKTFTNQFSQTLNLRPSAVWATKEGMKKFMSRFAALTAYKVDHKTSNDDPVEAYNPFFRETNDSNLISINTTFRSSLFFNQNSPDFGADLSWQDSRNKLLLNSGFDSRTYSFTEIRLRWNITSQWELLNSSKQGRKTSSSEFFTSRNYKIDIYETEPKLSFQPNTSFRSSFIYKYTNKQNALELGGQKALLQDFGAELKYNILSKGSFNIRTDFINISYDDIENSSLAFEMLEGLKKGKNYTWNISWQRNLGSNLQLNLTYDGRKSEGNRVIHTGGAQARAFF